MLDDVATRLDFEGVLGDLLGRTGEPVTLSVGDADPDGPPAVLMLSGTLAVTPLGCSWGSPAESFFLHIAEDPHSGAVLNRAHFAEAGVYDTGELTVRMGGVRLTIGPAPRLS
ncbi:MAG TPA: hypothetical protein VFR97_14655 [Capillimicrobium sp.]|nr:hypothetical protein [Capillimicrobium sp.]